MTGCLGYFDEFNHINLDVLTVAGRLCVVQQVACVLQAQHERKSEFVFVDGQTVCLRCEGTGRRNNVGEWIII